MRVIGITGLTGAGKTTALKALEKLGALILDCDAVYHELLRESIPMRIELEARFGDLGGVEIDRKKLGQVVFEDPVALEDLNRITHRYVKEEVAARLSAHEALGGELAAIDAVALLESGLEDLCDVTVLVTAPEEIRLHRIMARDGISEDYAKQRMAAQKPEAWFRKRCGVIIENDCESAAAFLIKCIGIFQTILGGTGMDELKKELLYERVSGLDTLPAESFEAAQQYCEGYKWFLDRSKTEREAVRTAIEMAEQAGFRAWDNASPLKPGDKVYRSVHGKTLMLAVIGKKPAVEGINIAAAHVDSPRLDLKPVPLYEKDGLALFKTHYYGGVRKYQWVTIPLELHGVVIRKDGTKTEVSIGGDPAEPAFVISDLLPHLAADQNKKTLGEAIPGENLNVIVGSRPEAGEGKDRIRLAVMKYLNGEYGITEEDFLSAELEIVPALRARDIGFDRSLIGAYGHDDRVCAYAELMALLDQNVPERTAMCIFADKEEVGSGGATGMQSEAFELFVGDLCGNEPGALRHCLSKSFCLSADVCNAFDPTWPEVSEARNNAILNGGIGIAKYTGARGKSGCNDADAETMGKIRRFFAAHNVLWQTAEMGRVDQGGGGTVAVYMARRNIETVDAGVPVLAMHAPFEIVAKLDCYMTYKGVAALFLENI